jgi:hypothetical protein
MSCQAEKRARAEAILGELAEISLSAAKEILVRLRASEDAQETAVLADALQKISRAARLTVALDFKLDRDAAREAREAQKAQAEAQVEAARAAPRPAPVVRPPHPIEARKTRVSNLLSRLLWNESEGDSEEFGILLDDLSARLHEAALSPDFEVTPIETLARRIAADMDLAGDLKLGLCEAPPPAAAPPEPSPVDTG